MFFPQNLQSWDPEHHDFLHLFTGPQGFGGALRAPDASGFIYCPTQHILVLLLVEQKCDQYSSLCCIREGFQKWAVVGWSCSIPSRIVTVGEQVHRSDLTSAALCQGKAKCRPGRELVGGCTFASGWSCVSDPGLLGPIGVREPWIWSSPAYLHFE